MIKPSMAPLAVLLASLIALNANATTISTTASPLDNGGKCELRVKFPPPPPPPI